LRLVSDGHVWSRSVPSCVIGASLQRWRQESNLSSLGLPDPTGFEGSTKYGPTTYGSGVFSPLPSRQIQLDPQRPVPIPVPSSGQVGGRRWDGPDVSCWSDAFALAPSCCVAYVWHASAHTCEVQAGLERVGFEVKQQIIWDKGVLALPAGLPLAARALLLCKAARGERALARSQESIDDLGGGEPEDGHGVGLRCRRFEGGSSDPEACPVVLASDREPPPTGEAVSLFRCERSRRNPLPKPFLRGAATAAHQVEGGNVASDVWRGLPRRSSLGASQIRPD
jgi:hypothetical protein